MARKGKKLLALVLCVAMLASMVVVSLPATADEVQTPARRTIRVVDNVAQGTVPDLVKAFPLVNEKDVNGAAGAGTIGYDKSTDTWSVKSITDSIEKKAGKWYNQLNIVFKQQHDVSGYGYFSVDVYAGPEFKSAGNTGRERLRVQLSSGGVDGIEKAGKWSVDTSKLVPGGWKTLYFSLSEPNEVGTEDFSLYAKMDCLRVGIQYIGGDDNPDLYGVELKTKGLTFYQDWNEATGITRSGSAFPEKRYNKTQSSLAIAGQDVGGGNKDAYGAAMLSYLSSKRLTPNNVTSAKAGDQIVFWVRADGAISSLKPYLMIDSGCTWDSVKADPNKALGGSIMRIDMDLPVGNDWQEVRVELPAETTGTKAYTVGADTYTVIRNLGSDEFNYAAINGLRIVSAGDNTYNTYFDAFHIAKVVALELDPGNTTFTEAGGSTYAPANLIVTAVYSDGHREVLENRDTGLANYTVDTTDVHYDVGGTYPVTVSYCGVTATFDITVNHVASGNDYISSEKMLAFSGATNSEAQYKSLFPVGTQNPCFKTNVSGTNRVSNTFTAENFNSYDGIKVWMYIKDISVFTGNFDFEISSEGTCDKAEKTRSVAASTLHSGLNLIKLRFSDFGNTSSNTWKGTEYENINMEKVNFFGVVYKAPNGKSDLGLSNGYLYKEGKEGTCHDVCANCGAEFDFVPCTAQENPRVTMGGARNVVNVKTSGADTTNAGLIFDRNFNGYGDGTSGAYKLTTKNRDGVIREKKGEAGKYFTSLAGCNYLYVNLYLSSALPDTTAILYVEFNSIPAGGTIGCDQSSQPGYKRPEVALVKNLSAGWQLIKIDVSSWPEALKDPGINYFRVFFACPAQTDVISTENVTLAVGEVYATKYCNQYDADGHYALATDGTTIIKVPHSFTNWHSTANGAVCTCDDCDYVTTCDHANGGYVASGRYLPTNPQLFEDTSAKVSLSSDGKPARYFNKKFTATDASAYDGIHLKVNVADASLYTHFEFELSSGGTCDTYESNWYLQDKLKDGVNELFLAFRDKGDSSFTKDQTVTDLSAINWLSVLANYKGTTETVTLSEVYLYTEDSKDKADDTCRRVCANCGRLGGAFESHTGGEWHNGVRSCTKCGYTIEVCNHDGESFSYEHADRLDVPYGVLHGDTEKYVELIKNASFEQNSETPAEPKLASDGKLEEHMEVSFTTADASQLSGRSFSFMYDGGAFSFFRKNQEAASTSYECDILAAHWDEKKEATGADFTIGDKKLYLRIYVDMTQDEISASKARLRFQLTTSGKWNEGGRYWDVNLRTLNPGWQTVTLDLNDGRTYGNGGGDKNPELFDLSNIRLFRSVLWFDNSVSFKIGDVWAGDVHRGVYTTCGGKTAWESCTYDGNGKCTVCGYERKDTEKEYDYHTYEEDADLLYFTGSWTRVAYYVPTQVGNQPKADFSGKHASRAFSSTAQLDFAFFGTELNIGTYFNKGQGTLKITLDGETVPLALGETSEGNGGQAYNLGEGYHRVNIQLSGDGAAWIDYIQVKGGLTPLLDEDVIDLSKRYNTTTIEAETEFVSAGNWNKLNYPKCSDGAALRILAKDVDDSADLQFTNVSGAEYLEVIGYKSKTHGKCQITIKAEGEEVALFNGEIDLSEGMGSFGVDNDYQALLVSQKVDPSKTYTVTVKPIAVDGHYFAMLLDCLKVYTAKK